MLFSTKKAWREFLLSYIYLVKLTKHIKTKVIKSTQIVPEFYKTEKSSTKCRFKLKLVRNTSI